jgi:hypothetical protein
MEISGPSYVERPARHLGDFTFLSGCVYQQRRSVRWCISDISESLRHVVLTAKPHFSPCYREVRKVLVAKVLGQSN